MTSSLMMSWQCLLFFLTSMADFRRLGRVQGRSLEREDANCLRSSGMTRDLVLRSE
ncbi:hypothetical protein BDV37DRAFT_254489 [Aspergillus pseudonomiae]|uniref:Uncharacterized protein n=1 Tax=Aspergillus pseudonomiae TaxID=1506151 RepID=A0A5N7D6X2_9EURO|nr:uncharacterized protein BDV37DRAFT_254489 [Aspergillus pseudonomiae]KAE8401653.1 hypothetical protein BDV37DRAFT_254489 [Aspergillus pseudonomiae]